MSETVKVISAENPNPWDHGITYYDMVFERNGQPFHCSWGTKGGQPQAGEEVTGEFSQKTDGEWKFTKGSKDKPAPSSQGASREATSGSARDWKPESQYDPEKTARIGRAHAQEMALRWATLLGDREITLPKLFQMADAFERDVDEAGQAASQGAGAASESLRSQASSPATTPAPEQLPVEPDDIAQYFTKLLEDAAVDRVAALELGKYIAHKFSDDQRKRAESGLRDLDVQGETVKRLTSAFEKSEGKLLPLSSDTEEDIPF